MSNSTSPVQIPRLPTELCEFIIDAVNDTMAPSGEIEQYSLRKRTLFSCALTCNTWLSRSLYLLYQFVHIGSSERLHVFRRALKMRPGLARHVRYLHLGSLSSPPPNRGRMGVVDSPWINAAALSLFPSLSGLISIAIVGMDFSHTHPRFFAALSSIKAVRYLSLAQVLFKGSAQFSRIVAAFPSLSHLSIRDIHAWSRLPQTVIPSGAFKLQARLTTIDLRCHTCDHQLQAIFDVCSWLCMTPSSSSPIDLKISQSIGHPLSSIEPNSLEDDHAGAVDDLLYQFALLSHNPMLRRLSISVTLLVHPNLNKDLEYLPNLTFLTIFELTVAFLHELVEAFQDLAITLLSGVCLEFREAISDVNEEAWLSLNSVFQKSTFQYLENVTISSPEIDNSLTELLSHLSQREILRLDTAGSQFDSEAPCSWYRTIHVA